MLVLSIEDDTAIRAILSAQFRAWQQAGQRVDLLTCGTLADGLAMNAEHKPEVVLLDLGLPDSAPEKTARAVGLFAGDPPPAVVILSGNERPTILSACFEAGADSYFVKAKLAKMETLFLAVLNASLRRKHLPFYARPR